jgi:tetratricopeptide (TPR) repeat protein
VLRSDPRYAKAYHILGAAYFTSSPPDYAKAIASYKEAERLDRSLEREVHDDLAKAYFELGLSLERAGKENEAKDAFKQAAVLDSKYDELLNQHGFEALQQRQWDQAISYFGKASRIDPNCAAFHYGRGTAFLGCPRANQNQPRAGEIRAAWVNGVDYRQNSYD